jgi:hypothetical protein
MKSQSLAAEIALSLAFAHLILQKITTISELAAVMISTLGAGMAFGSCS